MEAEDEFKKEDGSSEEWTEPTTEISLCEEGKTVEALLIIVSTYHRLFCGYLKT